MNLFEDSGIETLKKRYSNLHPLIFHRSVERARSLSDLFDILEQIPNKSPIVWDEIQRLWVHNTDVMSHEKLKQMRKRK